mmetsp:Transcript_9324/g.34191  ORF Transcript_9324/g.34191 Transcript_9324/m.34191 type:complete len:266 (+) Transcript_9324:98-895(+)
MGANGTTEQVSSPKFLVFGRTGWIGGMLSTMLEDMGYEYKYAAARLEDRGAVMAELEEYKPTHVLNAAGVTGRPNVDWCESHKVETLRTNVIGTLNCADCCLLKGVHYTLFATGCIYEYDVEHPLGSGRGFVEDDKPNFTGSYYSRTKAQVEEMLREYSNALVLRLRMPISDEVMHPRNFIKKIVGYERVVNIPNSMTILPEMVPMAIKLAARGKTGVYNFTNPGTISHNEYASHSPPLPLSNGGMFLRMMYPRPSASHDADGST